MPSAAAPGSLGHQRFVGLAQWQGGQVTREAKALVPSAWLWAIQKSGPVEILYQAITTQSVRCCDPSVELRGEWVLRRLAPDCVRVPLESLAEEKEALRLLRAMGWETANVHLGSPEQREDVQRHLAKLPKKWLPHAMDAMTQSSKQDYEVWSKEATSKATSAKNY